MSTATAQIDPNKLYSLSEIAKNGLIPNVRGYQTVYNYTVAKVEEDGKEKRVPVEVTSETGLKAISKTRPGSKISGKKYVKGEELIKFLKLNGYE